MTLETVFYLPCFCARPATQITTTTGCVGLIPLCNLDRFSIYAHILGIDLNCILAKASCPGVFQGSLVYTHDLLISSCKVVIIRNHVKCPKMWIVLQYVTCYSFANTIVMVVLSSMFCYSAACTLQLHSCNKRSLFSATAPVCKTWLGCYAEVISGFWIMHFELTMEFIKLKSIYHAP